MPKDKGFRHGVNPKSTQNPKFNEWGHICNNSHQQIDAWGS